MTTPWNIMDQLKNWARILQDHIDKLSLSAETTKKLQNESKYLYFDYDFTNFFGDIALSLLHFMTLHKPQNDLSVNSQLFIK